MINQSAEASSSSDIHPWPVRTTPREARRLMSEGVSSMSLLANCFHFTINNIVFIEDGGVISEKNKQITK